MYLKPHYQSKRLPLEGPVTICIAAMTSGRRDSWMVTVSDTKLTTGIYSQELGAWKIRRLNNSWSALVAGKFGQNRPIIEAITSEMADKELDVESVTKICTRVYIGQTKRSAEEAILAKHGLTMDEFLKSRKNLGDSLFERTWGEISRIEVGCELLVSGFDQAGPHIFCVSNPTVDDPSFISDRDYPSFAAIGSGSYLAESTLYAFGHTSITSVEDTIYQATVAKFVAEAASDVGTHTVILVFNKNGERMELAAGLEDNLRRRWLNKGRPSVPSDALEMIKEAMPKDANQTEQQHKQAGTS